MALPRVDAPLTGIDQRGRILDAALTLMSEQGSAGASMRQLAAACDLNVATLYHYFSSKADLLRSVIAERRYAERLAADTPPLRPTAPARKRLAALVEWIWANALEEEAVWRLLIGESLRGDPTAASSAAEVVDALADGLEQWLHDGFPELQADVSATARIVRGQVFSLVVEHLAVSPVSPETARQRADDLASLVFPGP